MANPNDPLDDQSHAPPAGIETTGAEAPPPGALRRGDLIPPDRPDADEPLARNLLIKGSGMYLYAASTQVFPQVKVDVFVEHVLQVVEDAGAPGDPLERLLIEQLVLLHHAGGRLLLKAEGAGSAGARSLLVAGAARVFSEYRKSLVALRAIEQSAAARERATADGDVVGPGGDVEPQPVSLARCDTEAPDLDRENQTGKHSPRRRSA